jgi:hypothetical protein
MGKRYSISNTSRVAHNYYRHQFNILINRLRRSLTVYNNIVGNTQQLKTLTNTEISVKETYR